MPHGAEGNETAVSGVMLPGANAAGREPSAVAGGGAGGLSGPGITSYSRPASSFMPEGATRPGAVKSGLLSAAESRGAVTAGAAIGAIPMSPVGAGTLARGKDAENQVAGPRARIVVEP